MSKFVITDIRIPNSCAEKFQNLGFEIVKLPPFSRLANPIASHPDMLMCSIGNKIITHKEYFEENRNIFNWITQLSEKEVVTCDEKISSSYPFDISLDALILKNTVFCLAKHTSKVLLDEASKMGYEIVDVKQGYAKCSVCPVSEMRR